MKSRTHYLTFTIPERVGFVNITPEVEDVVQRSGVKEGLCLVNAMHITARSLRRRKIETLRVAIQPASPTYGL